jgi:hypothetical protein
MCGLSKSFGCWMLGVEPRHVEPGKGRLKIDHL